MSRNYKILNPEGIYFITTTVVGWVDVFSRQIYRDIVIESLKYCQKNKGLVIYSFVIMSNHLHLIVKAENKNLVDVIRDFKKFTSGNIIKEISTNPKESRRKWMLNLFAFAGKTNSNNQKFQFWQQHNHPIELFSNEAIDTNLNYIHQNPVRNGLVENPEDYIYSSAKNYADEKGILEVEFLL